MTTSDARVRHLRAVEQRLLWLSHWMIHHANHLRPNPDAIKVGGHQASSASMVSIMTALYFSALRPEDRVAVKPHAAPVFHAIQYLMGNQSREKLEAFRAFGGAQSYPSRTKDVDDVDFSTGSVGLGVGITALAALVQDFIAAKPWGRDIPQGRMVALVGDAEMDESNVYEVLQEGWKNGLRNTWWIIDYNRQSLDGIVRKGLFGRIEKIFEALGWDVVKMKHGALQRAAFAEPGGDRLRAWIDACPNAEYAALTYMGGAVWRKRLMDDLGDQGEVTALIDRRSDAALAALMENLGGNCVETMAATFAAIDHDRPTCFLAYTIKGCGTPIAGHKDNHGGLMTKAQMAEWQRHMGVPEGQEWEPLAGVADATGLRDFLAAVRFFAKGARSYADAHISVPAIAAPKDREISTQAAFGKILDDLARGDSDLAARILTTSPDVTGTTSLGPWVNRRKLFARDALPDAFIEHRIPSTAKWNFDPEGQHLELGIAEMNLFLLLGAAGLAHSLWGRRLIPVGTVYDPFVHRGLDALNYACYQDARFLIAGTPSGVMLAPESGAHQSIGTPLTGMAQDGLAAFEPAFADELAVIMEWAFDYLQRAGKNDPDGRTWLRDETGGSGLPAPDHQAAGTARQARRRRLPAGHHRWRLLAAPAGAELRRGHRLPGGGRGRGHRRGRAPGRASARHRRAGRDLRRPAQRRRDGGSARACARQRRGSVPSGTAARPLPRDCAILTVLDGHPATLAWLGAVAGHRTIPHGVEHFGQTGTIGDLSRHFGLDRDTIVTAVEALTAGRPFGGRVA